MSGKERSTLNFILSLQEKGKETGTLLSFADALIRQGAAVSEDKTCASLSTKQEGLLKLVQALELYFWLAELPGADKDPNFSKINEAIDDGLIYASKLKVDIANCKMMDAFPGMAGAVSLNNAAQGRSSDEAELTRKILNTRIDRPCGFRSFDDYAGGKDFEEFFNKVAVFPYLYKNIGAEQEKIEGILLVGPPGTGKTLLAEAVAEKLQDKGCTFFSISSADILGKYVGESEKLLRTLFIEARRATQGGTKPVVIFVDEVDGILRDTSSSQDGGVKEGLVTVFNTNMDGLEDRNDPLKSNKGIIFICATNYPERIAASNLSRLKWKIYVGLPTLDNIREMIVKKIEKMGEARHDLDIDRIVEYDANGKMVVKIRKIHINNLVDDEEPAKNPKCDDIDIMCYHLYDLNINFAQYSQERDAKGNVYNKKSYPDGKYEKPYAPREIDSIFSFMRLAASYRSVRFLRDYSATGNNKQLWIVDQSQYEIKETQKNGKCDIVKKLKHAFVPIGPWNGNLEDSETVGSVYDKRGMMKSSSMGVKGINEDILKSNPAHGVKMYVTERKSNNNQWDFSVIGIEDEKKRGVINFDPNVQQITNIPTLLGIAQITMADFFDSLNAIKPIEIKDPAKLYNWSVQNTTSFKAGGSDLERLREMAERTKNGKRQPKNDAEDALTSIVNAIKKIQNAEVAIKAEDTQDT